MAPEVAIWCPSGLLLSDASRGNLFCSLAPLAENRAKILITRIYYSYPLKNIPHEDIRKETADNRKKLEEEGFWVVEMRECEWLKIKKQPEVSCFLKTLKLVPLKRKLTFEKIVEGIRSETLYGFLIVDIHTPNELKEKFKDFPLIIKNSFISRKDIGDYMQNVAEENNLLKKEQNYLISSYFAEKFLIT